MSILAATIRTIRPGLFLCGGAIVGVADRIITRIADSRAAARARAHLETLPDYLLADVGLCRTDRIEGGPFAPEEPDRVRRR